MGQCRASGCDSADYDLGRNSPTIRLRAFRIVTTESEKTPVAFASFWIIALMEQSPIADEPPDGEYTTLKFFGMRYSDEENTDKTKQVLFIFRTEE